MELRGLGERCKFPQRVRAERGRQTSFGESKQPFAAFWARLVRISCSLLKIFTSHNGNIQEEKVHIAQKRGRARDRGGPQEPKSGWAVARLAQ